MQAASLFDRTYKTTDKHPGTGGNGLKSIISLATRLENGPKVLGRLAEKRDGRLLKVILRP